ncbi:MAG TPA: MlaD family protein [Solirubrobacteraceae bacterium]|jgi:virulence factor Mce-like protein|nr:MlaD family protein [Solirubrobacteraceae bacterium]
MNRRRSNSLAGSPLLIGAITTLIVVVAVFLSYNANNGLPFTPTYDIKVQLPEASGLQKGNQVRIGGERVGVVSGLSPYQDPKTGRVTAIVSLKLEKAVEPLPADTTAIVQSVSTIGLKYLALERGHSERTLKAGETIPVSQTREPVDIDQFFDMFDEKTRKANQVNLTSFGNGFAGRGIGLNETISTLRPLVINAIPVLHNLASPQTGFGQLFVALDRAAKEVAPVANEQAEFYSNLDTFFTAWASVAPSLEQTIVGGPPALRQATYSFPFEAEFVNKSADFMRLLRPSAKILTTVAAPLGHAFEVGAVNLRSATALNGQVAEAAQAFAKFGQNPLVIAGIEDATHTLGLANPFFAGLAPAQTTCNYVTLTFRNLASLLSQSIGVGTLARAAPVLAPTGPNNEGFPSSTYANGPSTEPPTAGSPGPGPDNNHLHVNPYPNVAGPGQSKECEAGNEPYKIGEAVIGNVPENVGTKTEATERQNNLFGVEYPASTLEALGIKSSKGAKK